MRYQNPNCSYIDIRKPREEKKKGKTAVFFIRLFSKITESITVDFR